MRDTSEYEGSGVMPNGVFPKGNDALTASDKLRLGYVTGQEVDSRAKVDPGAFYGNEYFDPSDLTELQRITRSEARRTQRLARENEARYRETPR